MGQGRIVSGGPAGLYNIEVLYEISKVTARLVFINTRLGVLTAVISQAQAAIAIAEAAVAAAQAAMYTGEPKAAMAAVNKALETLMTKQKALSRLKLEQASLDKERLQLMGVKESLPRANVWCADLTENLAAGQSVGTIEINGESAGYILIMPGGASGIGKLQPTQANTPAGVFYNWALMACWQKWKPTYRVGEIKAFTETANHCNVCLDEAHSSIKGLAINQDGPECEQSLESLHTGFADFANRYPNHPIVTNSNDTTIPMTDQLRQDMDSVNRSINNNNHYKKDIDQYGRMERWDFMSLGGSGDCEDFALTKLQAMLDKGYPIGALKIETGLTTTGIGHAWLTVQTSEGDYGLDLGYLTSMPSYLLTYTDRAKQTGVNWRRSGVLLTNVPIDYMSGMDASAFVVGDRVVVAFTGQSWTAPKVIGFESNPRGLMGFALISYLDTAADRFKVRLYKILQSGAMLLTTSTTLHNSAYYTFGLWWDVFNNGIGFQPDFSGSNYYAMSKDWTYIKTGTLPSGYELRSSAMTPTNEQIFLCVKLHNGVVPATGDVKILDKNYTVIKSFNLPEGPDLYGMYDSSSFALLPDMSIVYKIASATAEHAKKLHFCHDGAEYALMDCWGPLEVPTFAQVLGGYFLTNMAGGSIWTIHGSIPTAKVFLSPLSNPASRTTIAESGKYTYTYTSYFADGGIGQSLTAEVSVTLSACITADGNFIVVTQPHVDVPEQTTYYPGGGQMTLSGVQYLAGWTKVYSIAGALLYTIPSTDISGSVQIIGAKVNDIVQFTTT